MGAGRYNSTSKNHGGEHTGIGKKQKTGKYHAQWAPGKFHVSKSSPKVVEAGRKGRPFCRQTRPQWSKVRTAASKSVGQDTTKRVYEK